MKSHSHQRASGWALMDLMVTLAMFLIVFSFSAVLFTMAFRVEKGTTATDNQRFTEEQMLTMLRRDVQAAGDVGADVAKLSVDENIAWETSATEIRRTEKGVTRAWPVVGVKFEPVRYGAVVSLPNGNDAPRRVPLLCGSRWAKEAIR